jgi:hypothetical protein
LVGLMFKGRELKSGKGKKKIIKIKIKVKNS